MHCAYTSRRCLTLRGASQPVPLSDIDFKCKTALVGPHCHCHGSNARVFGKNGGGLQRQSPWTLRIRLFHASLVNLSLVSMGMSTSLVLSDAGSLRCGFSAVHNLRCGFFAVHTLCCSFSVVYALRCGFSVVYAHALRILCSYTGLRQRAARSLFRVLLSVTPTSKFLSVPEVGCASSHIVATLRAGRAHCDFTVPTYGLTESLNGDCNDVFVPPMRFFRMPASASRDIQSHPSFRRGRHLDALGTARPITCRRKRVYSTPHTWNGR